MNSPIKSVKNICGLLALTLGTMVPTAAFAGHSNVVLHTVMDGASEVPAEGSMSRGIVGDPNGTGHGYVFGIDGDPTTLCYVITVDKIQLVPVGEGMAAHIHEGAADENGPVVAALAGPEDGDAADCLTEGEEGKFPDGEEGIVQRILNNPEDFYINVHNPEFPGGAIRGQLGPIESHSHEMDMDEMDMMDMDDEMGM